jgi:hypothetical protein
MILRSHIRWLKVVGEGCVLGCDWCIDAKSSENYMNCIDAKSSENYMNCIDAKSSEN